VTADIGICDTLVLAQLVAENAELRGDAVSEDTCRAGRALA
jgi:hypothetical protein